jgi:Ran GTPase-activating protein (RanGAP) involved in mRNA processing and transport
MKAEAHRFQELTCQFLPANIKSISELDVQYIVPNYICNNGVDILSTALQCNTQVHPLLLIDCNFSLQGCQVLGEMLKKKTCIKNCVLNENMRMKDNVIMPMSYGLFLNTTLQTLMLEQVDMGPDGMQVIASVIEVNQNLKEQSLGRNNPKEGIFDLA